MTSDERREVAARLRTEVSEGECIDYAVFRIINDVLGVNGTCGAKAARILADLIDPTCRNASGHQDGILHARTTGELVRCKDCTWACVPDDDGGYDVPFLACAWWMNYSRSSGDLFVEEDDFCSHGEKRETDHGEGR